jgi:hypothetical protein
VLDEYGFAKLHLLVDGLTHEFDVRWKLLEVLEDRRSGRGRALSANGPCEPLCECVRPRCADRDSDDADALGAEHFVEG